MDHSLTMDDHEPVASTDEPGEKAQYETGRSSPKLDIWFSTRFSSKPKPSASDSTAVTSAQWARTRARSAASRAEARRTESLKIHTRAARSSADPSV
jgi:hypothetical protein